MWEFIFYFAQIIIITLNEIIIAIEDYIWQVVGDDIFIIHNFDYERIDTGHNNLEWK